eukprot:COSAG05_NODE_8220_length_725_cov_1.468051_1_plen_236_part_10
MASEIEGLTQSNIEGLVDRVAAPQTASAAVGSNFLMELQKTNLVQRIRALFAAPESGSYKFYLRSSGSSELRLGGGHLQSTAETIAVSHGGVGADSWMVRPEQTSKSLVLQAGEMYYIEMLEFQAHSANTWRQPGHTAVGVELPSGVQYLPVPTTARSVPSVLTLSTSCSTEPINLEWRGAFSARPQWSTDAASEHFATLQFSNNQWQLKLNHPDDLFYATVTDGATTLTSALATM